MDHLKTCFQSSAEILDDNGGGAAQQVFDWQPVAVSAHSVGGNKAQCHGNHIKSTLKLIYLQKQWKLCWYLPLCCPRCMFLQSHVSLKGKKTIRWEFTCYGSFITKTSLSHLKQYILWVYVYDVFLVCQWLYLFYTVHTCMKYSNTAKGSLWIEGWSCRCWPWCSRSASTTLDRAVPFKAALRGGFSAIWCSCFPF